jgi:hypothetical protein
MNFVGYCSVLRPFFCIWKIFFTFIFSLIIEFSLRVRRVCCVDYLSLCITGELKEGLYPVTWKCG